AVLGPGASLLVTPTRATAITSPSRSLVAKRKSAVVAMKAPRIVIENVTPQIEHGQFAVKRALGEPLQVEADVFMDGHELIAVSLLWRPADESLWHEVPMRALGNDRWQAAFATERIGQHCYMVKAWYDVWGSHTAGLRKKLAAGVDV